MFKDYFLDEQSLETLTTEITSEYGAQGFDEKTIRSQLRYKLKIAATLEGHLISALNDVANEERQEFSANLAKQTLAYYLASSEQKILLVELFKIVASRIDEKVTSDSKKKVYSRTLLGLEELLEIDSWIVEHTADIFSASDDEEDQFELVYPVIEKYMDSPEVKKVTPASLRAGIAMRWIRGDSFLFIYEFLESKDARVQAGSQRRKITLHQVVDICERGFAFDGMLILGAVAELADNNVDFVDTILPDMLRALQKRIKYGLPSLLSIHLYEMGFRDRVIAQKIARLLDESGIHSRFMLVEALREAQDEVLQLLAAYPKYFREVFIGVLAG